MNHFKLAVHPLVSCLRNRHLLKEFVKKEVKGRFAGSAAGLLWTVLNPAASVAVYLFIFSYVLRVSVTAQETGTDSFTIFFLTGLFPWLLFSDIIAHAPGSLLGNSVLITKVVFPTELLPAATVFSSVVVNGLGFCVLFVYLIASGCFHWSWFYLFLVFPVLILFSWGLAFWIAAGCVYLRDIGEFIPIILMIWFYGSPLIYPVSMVPEGVRFVMDINPMAQILTLFRDVLLVHSFDWRIFAAASVMAFLSFLTGSWVFMRAKPGFGDVL
jgi:lipopolysaccharide transport system permease protein